MSEKKNFDIAIIGGGPGGYVAAIKAAQMKKSVALIEKQFLGGTCLNWGCIPTKTLIQSAEAYQKNKKADQLGIFIENMTFDFLAIKKRKDSLVKNLRNSLENLIKSNGITIFSGHGEFVSHKELLVTTESSSISIQAENIIIATGSEPLTLTNIPCDGQDILDSTSILELTSLPKSLTIIGGGVIGCEFASLYASFGVKVSIVEATASLLPNMETTLSYELKKSFLKQGIEIFCDAKAKKVEKNNSNLSLHLENGKILSSEKILVAVGRKLNVDNIKLEKTQVEYKKSIFVDNTMQTNIPGIYAIGDVTGKWMLAHAASHQGIVAAKNACSIPSIMDERAIPGVVFTSPQIATVGVTLEEAKKNNINAFSTTFPMRAIGIAHVANEPNGFVQIIVDNETKKILGAHMIGAHASLLIEEMTLAIQKNLSLEDISDTIHPHPTFSEAWAEVCNLAEKMPIHFPPIKE